MRDDVLFVYDLEVPADFVPHNTDGEIVDFTLMPAGERPRAHPRRPTISSSTSTW